MIVGLLYSFDVLLRDICVLPGPLWYFFLLLYLYSIVLKVP